METAQRHEIIYTTVIARDIRPLHRPRARTIRVLTRMVRSPAMSLTNAQVQCTITNTRIATVVVIYTVLTVPGTCLRLVRRRTVRVIQPAAAVPRLVAVTRSAEYLEAMRETLPDQPTVQVSTGTATRNLFTMTVAAPADVINFKLLHRAAACAVASVMVKYASTLRRIFITVELRQILTTVRHAGIIPVQGLFSPVVAIVVR
jgi:hypothetical protein